MKRLPITFLFTVFALLSFAQNTKRTYWGLSAVVHEEFQVNSNGIKHGFYKEYNNEGEIYKAGFYSNGKKSGTWTTYDLKWNGEIASTMQFSEGKMNGVYKQWCWDKSKRYLCGDYVYKDDVEMLAKQYFSNGKLQFERDRQKGTYNEWFEDGSRKTETINGKHYTFEWDGDKRKVSSLKFDSAGTFYDLYYASPSYELRSALLSSSKESTYIDFNNLEKPSIRVRRVGDSNYNEAEIEETPLDSVLFRLAFATLLNSPNPNNNRSNDIEFDFNTGTLKRTYFKKDYRTICYHNTVPITYTQIDYDPEGKPIILEIFNADYSKKNNGRSAVVKRFKDGQIFDEKNNSERYTIKYHDNGEILSQLFEAAEELNRPQTVYQEFFENGDVKIESVKDSYGSIISFVEYHENGRVKSERYTDKMDKKVLLDYNTEGDLIKITYLKPGGYNTEISDSKGINAFQFETLLDKFNEKYLVKKTAQNGNYSYDTYEYPKGENIYKRAKKVIDKYNLEIQYSTDQANSTKLISEYQVFIEKLVEIANTETLELNVILKKVKKIDDIKETILNWNTN